MYVYIHYGVIFQVCFWFAGVHKVLGFYILVVRLIGFTWN